MAFATKPDPSEIIRAPGFLYWGTTSLASEAGYGSLLGFCEVGVEVFPNYTVQLLSGEEWGVQPKIKVYLGSQFRVAATLKNTNNTTLSRLFPGLVSSSIVREPNNFYAGSNLLSQSGRLLFVPRDTVYNPILLLQKAAANIDQTFKYSNAQDTNYYCVFDAFRKTADADGTFYIGPIGSGVLR